jgi:hypothetical protein
MKNFQPITRIDFYDQANNEFAVSKKVSSEFVKNQNGYIRISPEKQRSYLEKMSSEGSPLEGKSIPIGPLDRLITAQALSLNRTLVTNTLKKFKRVPKLCLENGL